MVRYGCGSLTRRQPSQCGWVAERCLIVLVTTISSYQRRPRTWGQAWCMAGAESWMMATVAGGLAGLGHGYCFPILVSSLMTRVPEAMRGRAMAGFTGLWDIASLVAAPAVGKGIDVYGDSLAFWAMGAVALFGVSGWAILEYFSLRSFRRRYASSERR